MDEANYRRNPIMAGPTTEAVNDEVKELREDLRKVEAGIRTVSAPDPPSPIDRPRKFSPRWTRHRDAGRFSYMVGLTGTILFMATGLGPGWLGFVVAYLPASALAAWVTASHA
jgi:hypothetical protein